MSGGARLGSGPKKRPGAPPTRAEKKRRKAALPEAAAKAAGGSQQKVAVPRLRCKPVAAAERSASVRVAEREAVAAKPDAASKAAEPLNSLKNFFKPATNKPTAQA